MCFHRRAARLYALALLIEELDDQHLWELDDALSKLANFDERAAKAWLAVQMR